MWTIIDLAVLVVMIFGAWYLWFYYPIIKEIKKLPEYKEYETPKSLDQIWFDNRHVGKCSRCGLSDTPVEKVYNWHGGWALRCKWCRELGAIKLHLEENGVRRLKSKK